MDKNTFTIITYIPIEDRPRRTREIYGSVNLWNKDVLQLKPKDEWEKKCLKTTQTLEVDWKSKEINWRGLHTENMSETLSDCGQKNDLKDITEYKNVVYCAIGLKQNFRLLVN